MNIASCYRRNIVRAAALVSAGMASPSFGYVLMARWVERTGTVDTVIPYVGGNQYLDASQGATYRLRLQFGVFDDASGPAPAGGYLGWNVGTMNITNGQTATRTPGRLAPFNF